MSEDSAGTEKSQAQGATPNAEQTQAGRSEEQRSYRRAKEQSEAETPPEPDFQSFLAGLYTQTLVSLGAVENPVSGRRQSDLSQAQYLIDTIGMLKKKTEGNLQHQEQQYLLSLLQDLRMRYVRAVEAVEQQEAGGETQGHEEQQ
jgi:hypothetical protein